MDDVHIVVDLKKHAISLEFVGKVTNTKWNVKFLGMDAECHSGSYKGEVCVIRKDSF